jgi:hypothetical protein
MEAMKRVLFSFALAAALATAAGLPEVRKVYMLPMANGLDQYLANRLTNGQVFQVVTDPTLADAFFTDRIGEGFEAKLAELLPPPPEPKDAEPAKDEKDKTREEKEKKATEARGDIMSEPVNRISKAGAMSSISRARGNIFLVDSKTRQVVWSAFEPANDSTARAMDRTASQLATRIRRDLKKQ